ncbi:MAG: GTP 3',8-cyclase MoaA [Alphaproteobacteria bacterium]|nr:GTP 3',8-cyclase MoaA [Alphaproteobacteria bacterium]
MPGLTLPATGPLVDPFGRVHTYVRVSVTDRCNYRCTYCMPAEGLDFKPRETLLSFEEIERIVTVLHRLGIRRVRLTGGEPLVRRGLHHLVARLAALGLDDLAMTTNGELLGRRADELARAGLRRVNVSLDAIDPGVFAAMSRGGDVQRVLAGIDAARAAGLTPIKINAVMVAGTNDDQVLPLVRAFADHADDTVVRFIEYMPFGDARRQHLPAAAVRDVLARHYTLEPVGPGPGGPAVDWRLVETGQRIGFISPLTEHFCQACNRLRLEADGHLRTCLSRDDTPSLRDLLRGGASDDDLDAALRRMVWGKVAGHEADAAVFRAFEGVMTRIGG